ncbi:GntR family transcriptional regulator [uncultured Paludibaculum sp.]|uniref:GntR family transcriptional regulator n=1 Tax=uncultured Paludibaculum sp. TaxID=1765020 RepID=UPI002AAADE59|nr:GntR family transcriptional regulator [uncultured Paludibaculum sp.]
MSERTQIRVDLSASEPAYRQIAGQIRALLVEGHLTPGSALPSVRRLAMDLGVHFNTVAEAYRQLAEEGLIDVSHGKAARILPPKSVEPAADTLEQLRRRLRNMVAEMRASGMSAASVRREIHSLLEGEEQ